MNKAELIDALAKKADVPKASAGKVLDAFIDCVKSTLKKEDKVALIGFGTFGIAKRKARKGRNPRTGKEISIPAKKVQKFTPGNELKKAVQ